MCVCVCAYRRVSKNLCVGVSVQAFFLFLFFLFVFFVGTFGCVFTCVGVQKGV